MSVKTELPIGIGVTVNLFSPCPWGHHRSHDHRMDGEVGIVRRHYEFGDNDGHMIGVWFPEHPSWWQGADTDQDVTIWYAPHELTVRPDRPS